MCEHTLDIIPTGNNVNFVVDDAYDGAAEGDGAGFALDEAPGVGGTRSEVAPASSLVTSSISFTTCPPSSATIPCPRVAKRRSCGASHDWTDPVRCAKLLAWAALRRFDRTVSALEVALAATDRSVQVSCTAVKHHTQPHSGTRLLAWSLS